MMTFLFRYGTLLYITLFVLGIILFVFFPDSLSSSSLSFPWLFIMVGFVVLTIDLVLKGKYEWVCRECGDERGSLESMLPAKHCVKCGGVMELTEPR